MHETHATHPADTANARLADPWSARTGAIATFETSRRRLFGGCDYLGLASHPRVIAAAHAALDVFGISAGASRTTSGNTTAHTQLERDLTDFFHAFHPGHAAAITLDGLTANMAAFSSLAPDHDTALIDARAHRSLAAAAKASGFRVIAFQHADPTDAARIIQSQPNTARVVIATDGVFAADGVPAPISALHQVAAASGAALLIDDCHGLGVLGPGGRGTLAAAGIHQHNVILTATLAKGIGAAGGFVLAHPTLHHRITTEAIAFVGTTPIPPALAAAASAALRVVDQEPDRIARMRTNAALLHRSARSIGLSSTNAPECDSIPVLAVGHIAPGTIDRLAAEWTDAGLFVPLITYPGGPAARYFRIAVTADHTKQDIDTLIAVAATAIRSATRKP